MSSGIEALRNEAETDATVHLGDARQVEDYLEPSSTDAVITSPPYPNEKDYTRTTRLESVLLGFIKDKQHLRGLKQELVRSNTRSVYKQDTDDTLVAKHEGIQRIANLIEERRIQLGKTSGFERQYARVTKLYFGGMVRHLLIDIFTGITCYSLQSHLRTSVTDIGQVETDELYVGVDTSGCQYVIPVQAKGGSDTLNIVQIEQDIALCESKFSELVCRPVAAQFTRKDVIALFAFEKTDSDVKVLMERHYRLVDQSELTDEDLALYRQRL